MADAGVPNVFKTRFTYIASNPSSSAEAQVVQANLKRIGIDVVLEPVETAAYLAQWSAKSLKWLDKIEMLGEKLK